MVSRSNRRAATLMARHWRWLCTFSLLLCLVGIPLVVLAQVPADAVGVYYVGPQDAVAEAIQQSAPYLVFVDRPELAQVYVLNNAPLTQATLQIIGRQVLREEVGLVVFAGDLFPQSTLELRALLGVGAFGLASNETPREVVEGEGDDPLQAAIAWSSAPEIRARTVISNPNLLYSIVRTTAGEPLVQRVRGREQTQVFVAGIEAADAGNAQWASWPYFNYFVYRMVAEAGNAARVVPFSDFPRAPVPQAEVRLWIAAGGVGLMLLALAAFFLGRRALFLRPAILDALSPTTTPSEERNPTGWELVGFHRPLASLLFLLGAGIVGAVPWVGYQLVFLPQTLIPWPQVLNFWDIAARWSMVGWLLLDAGVGTAAVWFFATLRPVNPREGRRYFRFFVWWQLLGGAFQVGSVALLVALVFPEMGMAHLSFYFVVHALLQFPGFLGVFRYFFRAHQRLDYEQFLTLLLWLGPLLFQTVAVAVMRGWGRAHVAIGESLGGVFGLGLGLVVTEVIVFLSGAILYKRMGYALRAILLPAFEQRIVGRALSFGVRLAWGTLALPVSYLVQVFVLADRLSDVGRLQENWQLALSLTLVYEVLSRGLYGGLMPAIAESYTRGYRTLTRYYVSQGLHYGMWCSFFVLAGAGALGDRLILGILGEAEAGALTWLPALLIWGALQWPAWTAEQTLIAVERPGLRSWLLVGEQALRLSLIFILTPVWQLWGWVAAYILALLARALLGLYLAGRIVGPPRLSFWQMAVAPSGAALILYNLLRLLGDVVWQPTVLGTLIFLAGALVAAAPLYGFLTAFLGGWDTEGIAELRQAVALSGLGRPVAGLLLWGVEWGARISPLHDRFPMVLRRWALEEAQALTFRRPPLR